MLRYCMRPCSLYGGGDDIRSKLACFGRMSCPVSPVVLSYRFSDADISYPRSAWSPNPSAQYGKRQQLERGASLDDNGVARGGAMLVR
jgi:hypothetical protein